jgi:hypothetical protein
LTGRKIWLDSVIGGTAKVVAQEWDLRTYSAGWTQKEGMAGEKGIPGTTHMLPKLSRKVLTSGLLYLSRGPFGGMILPLEGRNPKEIFLTYRHKKRLWALDDPMRGLLVPGFVM